MKPNRLMWIVGVLLFSLFVSSVTAAPLAGFSGTPVSGSAPLTVAFTDGSTGSPTGWAWFFGDENWTAPWTLMNANSGWIAREQHSSVVMPDGSIVLMGGIYNVTSSSGLNDTWRSTDNGATWTRVNASSGWSARWGHSSVVMPDGSIVLMGGSGNGWKNDTWRSIDNGATWTQLNPSSKWSARSYHTSVALQDGSIVLMGGWDNSGYKNDTWRSIDNGATWTLVNPSSGWSARQAHSSVGLPDNSIVLTGGKESSGAYKNDTWRSTDNGATWTQVNPSSGWSVRWLHTSVAMPDSSIVLTGGAGSGGLKNGTWRSTDNGATWTQLVTPGWSSRESPGIVVMPDGSIVLTGGKDSSGPKNDTWRFMPVGSSLQNPSHTYTQPGTYPVALQVYNTGGYSSTQKTGYIEVSSGGWDGTSCTEITTPGTYQLQADIQGTTGLSCIVIRSSDVLFEGNGHTLNGTFLSENGVVASAFPALISNVSVRNLTISHWNQGIVYQNVTGGVIDNSTVTFNFEQGISLGTSSSVSLKNINASFNRVGIGVAEGSDYNTLSHVTASRNDAVGVWFYAARHNTVSSGTFEQNNGPGLVLEARSINNTISENMANSNSNGFFIRANSDGFISPYPYGPSDNNIIANNTAKNNTNMGIFLYESASNNNITGNKVTNNRIGVHFNATPGVISGNIIFNNNASFNTEQGVLFTNATVNTLTANTANSNGKNGIFLFSKSYGNFLSDNIAASNGIDGLVVSHSRTNNLTHNQALNNIHIGINLDTAENITVFDNFISGNDHGILLYFASNNTIINNSVSANNEGFRILIDGNNAIRRNTVALNTQGIWVNSSRNTISDNNFYNTNNAIDGSITGNYWNTTRTAGTNIIGGSWLGGNFWSDYTGADTNGDGIGNTLVPYNAGGNIITGGDMLPLTPSGLVAPVASFNADITSGAAPLPVSFTDLSLNNPTGWAWFFGDENFTTPWTRQTASAGWSSRSSHSSVTMPDGSIVLTGGWDISTNLMNDSWRSTDNGATWTQQTASAGWMARADHSSVAMPDGSIVLMGGYSGGQKNDVWRSANYGATWTPVTASAGWTGRWGHSSVVMPDGSIVLMGGFDGTNQWRDVWRSTDKGTTWNLQTASAGWSSRSLHSSVVMPDGSIVLTGGYDGSYRNDVWRSTDSGATWTQMNASAGWSIRRGQSSVAMPDGSIVLMGGTDAGSSKNDIWRSTDNGAIWMQLLYADWSARGYHSSVAMPDGSIVLMGGDTGSRKNDVWRFMPGGSSLQNPSHIYTAAGTYPVALQAYNAGGYNSTRKTGYITITGSSLLVANFTTDVTSGVKPLTVKFTDISTGNPTTVNMSFGDAMWANTTGPWVHTYMNEGTFFPVIYASDGITNSSGTNATISVNVTTGLDTGLAKAYNAVLNNATILNGTATGKSISASPVQITAGSQLQRWGGKPAIQAPTTGWLIFLDDYPGANWEHPCRYVFVDANGKTTVVKALSPPTNINLKQIAGDIQGPGGDANSVNSVSQNPGGGLGALNLQLACTGPDCSHNYALLISGGFNTTQNHIRYWNDISFMYQTLNQTYGYPADHITVLMSDGTSPAADRHNATAANGDILTDNSPVNLDTLYGTSDLTGDAKKLTLTNTLTSLNSRLTPADNLFIFTTSHGGWDDVLNSNNSILYLWNEEYISDSEFVAALPATPGNITMVMEQCYSGGFVDNFIDKYSGPQRRVIATAANGNEPSWGNGFSNAWTSGVARIDEARLPNFRADINTDNKISMYEAYNYSLFYDPKASVSLPVHEHPQFSAKNPVTAGTTQYLSTCPVTVLPTLTVTGPTNVETWYMGYPRNITWTQTGLDSTTVTISLWNRTPGVKQLDIATNVPASPGIYTWTIPTGLAAGNDYRLNISSVGSPASIVYDQSNSPFILAKYAVPGFITVNSVPSGAGVYLDGYNLSKKTNVTIPGISPGSHNVTVKLAGYYEQDSGIIVTSGKTSILNFTLESTGTNEPPYGTMIITSTPPAAEVVINGMATGLMTPYRKEVDPGTYAVTVKAYNYTTPVSQSVTVIKGKQVSADFTLVLFTAVKPLPGYFYPPTDPDHDGIYEDLNGNGRLDFADVVLYFNQMEWLAANEPVSAFDLNGNGRIDFADIVRLFGEI